MELYLPVLQKLTQSGVEYAAIGTWALKVYFPAQMRDYVLHDCDLVLAPSLENVQLASETLKEDGWEVKVWEEALPEDLTESFLKGKYYLRARKLDLALDLTYECRIPWEEMVQTSDPRMGVRLAAVAHILALKYQKMLEQGNEDAFKRFEKMLYADENQP